MRRRRAGLQSRVRVRRRGGSLRRRGRRCPSAAERPPRRLKRRAHPRELPGDDRVEHDARGVPDAGRARGDAPGGGQSHAARHRVLVLAAQVVLRKRRRAEVTRRRVAVPALSREDVAEVAQPRGHRDGGFPPLVWVVARLRRAHALRAQRDRALVSQRGFAQTASVGVHRGDGV
eukprot:30943-Pelagococcus_subviridis.AAC.24